MLIVELSLFSEQSHVVKNSCLDVPRPSRRLFINRSIVYLVHKRVQDCTGLLQYEKYPIERSKAKVSGESRFIDRTLLLGSMEKPDRMTLRPWWPLWWTLSPHAPSSSSYYCHFIRAPFKNIIFVTKNNLYAVWKKDKEYACYCLKMKFIENHISFSTWLHVNNDSLNGISVWGSLSEKLNQNTICKSCIIPLLYKTSKVYCKLIFFHIFL